MPNKQSLLLFSCFGVENEQKSQISQVTSNKIEIVSIHHSYTHKQTIFHNIYQSPMKSDPFASKATITLATMPPRFISANVSPNIKITLNSIKTSIRQMTSV